MKANSFNKTIIAMVILAAAPYAQAKSLSRSELSSVRGVLRAMNINEAQLSNEDIQALRSQGDEIRSYEKSKSDFLQKASSGEVYMTCGGGSHGSGKDPV